MNKLLMTMLVITIAVILAACNPTPTALPPTVTPAPSETPVPSPTQVPGPNTWLLACKQSKCPIFISTGFNDSGLPIVAINSGEKFELDERVEFYYPCLAVDGGDIACEIYRDSGGHIYPRGRYNWRDQLKRVW